jgi:hypothetical protein
MRKKFKNRRDVPDGTRHNTVKIKNKVVVRATEKFTLFMIHKHHLSR